MSKATAWEWVPGTEGIGYYQVSETAWGARSTKGPITATRIRRTWHPDHYTVSPQEMCEAIEHTVARIRSNNIEDAGKDEDRALLINGKATPQFYPETGNPSNYLDMIDSIRKNGFQVIDVFNLLLLATEDFYLEFWFMQRTGITLPDPTEWLMYQNL